MSVLEGGKETSVRRRRRPSWHLICEWRERKTDSEKATRLKGKFMMGGFENRRLFNVHQKKKHTLCLTSGKGT